MPEFDCWNTSTGFCSEDVVQSSLLETAKLYRVPRGPAGCGVPLAFGFLFLASLVTEVSGSRWKEGLRLSDVRKLQQFLVLG